MKFKFFPTKVYHVTILFKSGNRQTFEMTEFTVVDGPTSPQKLTWKCKRGKLMYIDLSQIEAIFH